MIKGLEEALETRDTLEQLYLSQAIPLIDEGILRKCGIKIANPLALADVLIKIAMAYEDAKDEAEEFV